jgi:hypothetical protein
MMSGRIAFVLYIFFLPLLTSAQNEGARAEGYVTIPAGTEYKKSGLYQWLFGKNRRKEWAQPVRVRSVMLDTVYGGLVPYQKSGNGESKSLRLRSTSGKEYALRSINKSRIRVLTPLLQYTFYGSLVQDGVSMSHPYGAFAIPLMADAARIPHTRPLLVFIPQQEALDSFNAGYANDLYLLEERAEGNWSDAPHLGNYKQFLETTEVEEMIRKNNRYTVDQYAFIKARLFDMLLADVDRHEGNWRWGVERAGSTIFRPVPGDRDQAFFTHNGLLTTITLVLTRRRMLQNFGYRIRSEKSLTTHDLSLDKFFSNAMTADDWKKAAKELIASLSDSVIAASVAQMPPEVFKLSGKEIVSKLQSRRNGLERSAARYYKVLAKRVRVYGSKAKEQFEASAGPDGTTTVRVYRVGPGGKKEGTPYYTRSFSRNTKLVTFYSYGGDDVFEIDRGIRGLKIKIKKRKD